MVTKLYTLLFFTLLSGSVNSEVLTDAAYDHVEEERLAHEENLPNPGHKRVDASNNRGLSQELTRSSLHDDHVSRIGKRSTDQKRKTSVNRNFLDYKINGNIKRGNDNMQSSRRKRNAYEPAVNYNLDENKRLSKSGNSEPHFPKMMDNRLMENPSVQRMIYKLIIKKNRARHTQDVEAGKKTTSGGHVDLYDRSDRDNAILHIPFGKRELAAARKRDMSAAYGNFGGPFGKRSSAEEMDIMELGPLQSPHSTMSSCVYLSKLGFQTDKCEELNKALSNREGYISR